MSPQGKRGGWEGKSQDCSNKSNRDN
jgi:hypothetical protein